MRIAFISDLHGCLDAVDNVIFDARSRGVDDIVCLGDIVDMGPQPAEVVQRLQELGIKCVRGNHDPLDEHPQIEFLQDLENWTRDQLSQDQRHWLEALPFQRIMEIESVRLLLVHASPDANTEGLVAETPDDKLNDWLVREGVDAILAGHTHVPLIRRVLNGLIVNVGSAAMPFSEPLPKPTQVVRHSDYAIVEVSGGAISVEQRRLPLDFEALKQAVEQKQMPHGEILLGAYASI